MHIPVIIVKNTTDKTRRLVEKIEVILLGKASINTIRGLDPELTWEVPELDKETLNTPEIRPSFFILLIWHIDNTIPNIKPVLEEQITFWLINY